MKRQLRSHSKGIALAVLLALLPVIPASNASASKTYEVFSDYDSNDARTDPNYDLSYISVAEWSEYPGDIFFYLFFETPISRFMFNDGRKSWGGIFIDTNFDGTDDISIVTNDQTYPLNNTLISAYSAVNGRSSGCTTKTFSNINESASWIGFKVSKSCLRLPNSFNVQGYADFVADDNSGFDYAPETPMSFNLSSGTTTTTTTTVPGVQVPNAPSSLAVTATSNSSLHMTWIDNSSNEDGFLIQRDDLPVAAGTSTAAWPYKTAASVASWDVTGLATGKRYCFAISAYNAAGASKFTDWGCIDLGAATPIVGITSPQLTCDATRGKKTGTTILVTVQAGTTNAGKKLAVEAYVSGKWVNIGSARVTAAGVATLKPKVSVVKTKGVITIRATQGSRFICEGSLRGST
jgi:hypothetical protein